MQLVSGYMMDPLNWLCLREKMVEGTAARSSNLAWRLPSGRAAWQSMVRARLAKSQTPWKRLSTQQRKVDTYGNIKLERRQGNIMLATRTPLRRRDRNYVP